MTDRLDSPRRCREELEALLCEHVPNAEVWAYGRSRVNGRCHSGRRCVHCVAIYPVLPRDTQYYDPLLYFMSSMDRPIREIVRERWFTGALDATRGLNIVYLDPDTGLAPDAKKFHQDGPKYAYLDDLRAFWKRGQSLMIYQQQARRNLGDLIGRVTADLRRGGLDGAEPIPLRFSEGTSRVFFVLPQPEHRERIEARIGRMLGTPWRQHFERV